MGNFVFNVAKGRAAYYATLPAANDALLVVPLEASGLEADDVLNNYDDLAALLAASNNEQTTMSRKTGITASVTVTVDDTNNWVDVDLPDQTWINATGNAIGALLICYDNDTTSGTDANIIPLTKHDFVVTPDGSDVIAQVAASGFYRAS
jgi:hypothetical protein